MLSYGVEPSWPVGECLGSERSAAETEIRSSVYRRMGILGKFRQLLFCETESKPRSGGGQDFLPTVPFSYTALEDLNLIKPMMQRLMQRGSQFGSEIPKQQVASAGPPEEPLRGKHLSQELGEAVLPLMLESLLQDKKLLPSARDLIRRMEPALLLLVRSDPRFFSDHRHPARELLAWLISHGQVGSYQNQRQQHRFLALVARAIPVLQSPQVGAASFAAVLRQLEGEWTPDVMKLSSTDECEPHYC
jgi:hypothetical protein